MRECGECAKRELGSSCAYPQDLQAGLPACSAIFGLPGVFSWLVASKNILQWHIKKTAFSARAKHSHAKPGRVEITAAGPLPLFTGFPFRLRPAHVKRGSSLNLFLIGTEE